MKIGPHKWNHHGCVVLLGRNFLMSDEVKAPNCQICEGLKKMGDGNNPFQ